jgi:hypothetical protein
MMRAIAGEMRRLRAEEVRRHRRRDAGADTKAGLNRKRHRWPPIGSTPEEAALFGWPVRMPRGSERRLINGRNRGGWLDAANAWTVEDVLAGREVRASARCMDDGATAAMTTSGCPLRARCTTCPLRSVITCTLSLESWASSSCMVVHSRLAG